MPDDDRPESAEALDGLRDPWLVAAWPGMGGVALLAVSHLIEALGAEPIGTIPPGEHFDLAQVSVKQGLVQPHRLPESRLHAWRCRHPEGRDLVLFLGEAQPSFRGHAFSQTLIDRAIGLGVRRVVTFAAMASPVHPKATPRVFAAANRPAVVAQLERETVELLPDGEISGLNGVLVASASERDLEAVCLLGEFPYFATAVPNPKASVAVLRVFASMAGIEVDLGDLEEQADRMEERLTVALERLQRAARMPSESEGGEIVGEEETDEGEETETAGLDPADVARIEDLFQRAERERDQAMRLKAELDRLGVFKRYEDRFLDLFRRGE